MAEKTETTPTTTPAAAPETTTSQTTETTPIQTTIPESKPADPTAKPAEKPVVEDKPTTTALGGEHETKPKEGDQPNTKVEEKKTDNKKTEDKAAPKAPERYEPFTLDDGITMDEESLAEFVPVAKELDLTQEQAQKLVTLEAGMRKKQAQQWTDQVAGWLTQSKADPEFGGVGFDGNKTIANKAVNEFGTPALRKLFDEFGIGNHPEIIRAFYRVGRAFGESVAKGGSNSASEPVRTADMFYNNANKE